MEDFVLQACSVIGLAKISVLFMTAGSLALLGQSLSIGVKGGVRASDDFQYAATSESRRYAVGPMLEVALPLGFAIEFDALYRRQGFSIGNSTPLYSSSTREADNVWEFPLLARYRTPLRGIRRSRRRGGRRESCMGTVTRVASTSIKSIPRPTPITAGARMLIGPRRTEWYWGAESNWERAGCSSRPKYATPTGTGR